MDGPALDASILPFGHATHEKPADGKLQRIAELLGCGVDAFDPDAPPDGGLGATSELLRLWLSIPDADSRARILALAKSLASN